MPLLTSVCLTTVVRFSGGATADPSKGEGVDYGIDFNLFNNRVNGRLVYYETEAIQEVVGGSQASNPMEAIYEAYEDAFTPALDDDGVAIPGTGNQAALDNLLSRRQELRPEVNGRFRDNISSGYELRLTANMTENWRVVLNAAHTDRIVSNMFSKAVDFLGLTEDGTGRVTQGATEAQEVEDPDDPGALSKVTQLILQLTRLMGLSLNTSLLRASLGNRTLDNTGISRSIFDIADNINEQLKFYKNAGACVLTASTSSRLTTSTKAAGKD